jgi:hypothetical protein
MRHFFQDKITGILNLKQYTFVFPTNVEAAFSHIFGFGFCIFTLNFFKIQRKNEDK